MHNVSRFPQMLYRAPGPVVLEGHGFEHKTVASEEALTEALADGWHETIDAAKAAHESPKVEPVSDAPPTRAELEQKAKELGLKFDGRTPDKKLAALIAEKV